MGDETRDERQDRDEKRRQEETVGGQTVRQTDRQTKKLSQNNRSRCNHSF
jgi:hypothetical protein